MISGVFRERIRDISRERIRAFPVVDRCDERKELQRNGRTPAFSPADGIDIFIVRVPKAERVKCEFFSRMMPEKAFEKLLTRCYIIF